LIDSFGCCSGGIEDLETAANILVPEISLADMKVVTGKVTETTKLYVDAAAPITPGIKRNKSPRGSTPSFFAGEGGNSMKDDPRANNNIASAEDQWVQCDKCGKWRRLPPTVDLNKLPARWYCHMNKYNPAMANCEAKEEAYGEVRH